MQLSAEAGTIIAQRSCLCSGGFKRSCARVGSSDNNHSIVVDGGDHFGVFWPLFPLLVLRESRGAGRWARLAGIPREGRVLFLAGSCFHPGSLLSTKVNTKPRTAELLVGPDLGEDHG
jgi:hypothetical protein